MSLARGCRLAARPRAGLLGSLVARRQLSQETLGVIRDTLPAVAQAGTAFTGHFYQRMFKEHPELLNTFNRNNQMAGKQQRALFSAVAASAVSVLEHGTLPLAVLETINQKHCALQVVPDQYQVVGTHILGTITDLLNPPQNVLDAWGEVYGVLAEACIKREEEIYSEVEGRPGGWRGMRDFVVSKKEGKSNNVTEFTFTPKDGKPVCSFTPGQYTTVWFHPEEWEYRQPRHYSICSKPNGETFTIAVKKEKGGLVSSHLHEKVAEGDIVPLSPPYGDFRLPALWTTEREVPLVLISGGIGITPTLSMLSSIKDDDRPIVWLHGAKHGHEHPFRDYLVGLGKALKSNFQRRVWYSNPLPDDVKGSDNTALYHFDGHMNLQQVKDLLPQGNAEALYFMCGHKDFMTSVGKDLLALGVDKKQIHFEYFGPADESPL